MITSLPSSQQNWSICCRAAYPPTKLQIEEAELFWNQNPGIKGTSEDPYQAIHYPPDLNAIQKSISIVPILEEHREDMPAVGVIKNSYINIYGELFVEGTLNERGIRNFKNGMRSMSISYAKNLLNNSDYLKEFSQCAVPRFPGCFIDVKNSITRAYTEKEKKDIKSTKYFSDLIIIANSVDNNVIMNGQPANTVTQQTQPEITTTPPSSSLSSENNKMASDSSNSGGSTNSNGGTLPTNVDATTSGNNTASSTSSGDGDSVDIDKMLATIATNRVKSMFDGKSTEELQAELAKRLIPDLKVDFQRDQEIYGSMESIMAKAGIKADLGKFFGNPELKPLLNAFDYLLKQQQQSQASSSNPTTLSNDNINRTGEAQKRKLEDEGLANQPLHKIKTLTKQILNGEVGQQDHTGGLKTASSHRPSPNDNTNASVTPNESRRDYMDSYLAALRKGVTKSARMDNNIIPVKNSASSSSLTSPIDDQTSFSPMPIVNENATQTYAMMLNRFNEFQHASNALRRF